jgi:hypothetical protein
LLTVKIFCYSKCKVNPVLHLHGNSEQFYVLHRCMLVTKYK